MSEEEKRMWDWLCDNVDAWGEYAKKEEEKDVQKNSDEHNRDNHKFDYANSRIVSFLNKHNNNTV